MLNHWRDAGEDGEFPSFDAITKQEVGDDWAACFLLRMPGDGREAEFLFIGQSFDDPAYSAITGKGISLVSRGTLLGQTVQNTGETVKKRVPITRGGEFTDAQGQTVLYRSTLLPISEDKEVIELLLGAANCKVQDSDEQANTG